VKENSWWQRHILNPLFAFLKQGTTPEKLALCVALGMSCGIIPVLGVTTVLSIVVALIFRLNQPAMQLVNHLMYPAQLALIIPFFKVGDRVFSSGSATVTAGAFFHAVKDHPGQAIAAFWQTTLYALAIWLVLVPVIALPAYLISLRIFRRWKASMESYV
jgi:uncharacterized protein (DUF2062 family)